MLGKIVKLLFFMAHSLSFMYLTPIFSFSFHHTSGARKIYIILYFVFMCNLKFDLTSIGIP